MYTTIIPDNHVGLNLHEGADFASLSYYGPFPQNGMGTDNGIFPDHNVALYFATITYPNSSPDIYIMRYLAKVSDN